MKFTITCNACGSTNVDIDVVVPEEEVRIICEDCGNKAQGHDAEDLTDKI